MSSISGQKFQNDKNQKKKNQQFKASQKDNMALAEAETTNVDSPGTAEKSSLEFLDLKDFPELKVPGKFSSESKNFKLKNKEGVPTVSYGAKVIPGETFAAISAAGSKSVKTDVVNLVTREKQMAQTVVKYSIAGTNKGKKPISLKKTSTQVQRNPNKKKRADPIFINFQDFLMVNKIQRKPKQHNIVRNNAQRFKDRELLSGNLLDSSNPNRSRGKHREIKKKKLSNFKMTIIKERILKQKLREKQTEDPQFGSECFNMIDAIDFKTEINIYVNELSKKKQEIVDIKHKLNEDKNAKKIIEQNQGNVKTESVKKSEKDLEKITSDIKEKKLFSTTAEGELKFSSKFREYCDNILTPELNAAVTVLIKELIKLQDRLFLRDPIKAKAKKRHVSGIREIKKYLTLKKVKMILIAPNLEKLQMEGSVYDSINQLKSMAESQNVPFGFALDRHKLGKCTKKNVPVSAFAVLNYEGIETVYENVLSELLEAKRKFYELAGTKKKEKANDVNSQIISSLISAFRDELKMSSDVESCLT